MENHNKNWRGAFVSCKLSELTLRAISLPPVMEFCSLKSLIYEFPLISKVALLIFDLTRVCSILGGWWFYEQTWISGAELSRLSNCVALVVRGFNTR